MEKAILEQPKLQRGLMGDLWVGTHNVINNQLPYEIWQLQNCSGILKDRALWSANTNLGFIKVCGLSVPANYVQKLKINNFFSMTTKASKLKVNQGVTVQNPQKDVCEGLKKR